MHPAKQLFLKVLSKKAGQRRVRLLRRTLRMDAQGHGFCPERTGKSLFFLFPVCYNVHESNRAERGGRQMRRWLAVLLVLVLALAGGCTPQELQEPSDSQAEPAPVSSAPTEPGSAVVRLSQAVSGELQCLKSRGGRCLAVYGCLLYTSPSPRD